jgi:hypothetical protein
MRAVSDRTVVSKLGEVEMDREERGTRLEEMEKEHMSLLFLPKLS